MTPAEVGYRFYAIECHPITAVWGARHVNDMEGIERAQHCPCAPLPRDGACKHQELGAAMTPAEAPDSATAEWS